MQEVERLVSSIVTSSPREELLISERVENFQKVNENNQKETQEIVSKERDISISEKDIKEKLDSINNVMENFNKKIRFRIFKDTNDVYVQIVSADTGEVIKTIPPENVLKLVARIHEVIGVFIDKYI